MRHEITSSQTNGLEDGAARSERHMELEHDVAVLKSFLNKFGEIAPNSPGVFEQMVNESRFYGAKFTTDNDELPHEFNFYRVLDALSRDHTSETAVQVTGIIKGITLKRLESIAQRISSPSEPPLTAAGGFQYIQDSLNRIKEINDSIIMEDGGEQLNELQHKLERLRQGFPE